MMGTATACTLVVGVGDGLASDVELARWASGVVPEAPSVESAGIALSDRDLETIQEQRGVAALASSGAPVVAVNVLSPETGRPLLTPYQEVSCVGHTIAILGVTQGDSAPPLEVGEPLASVKPIIRQLQRKADILILLSNAGSEQNRQIATALDSIDVLVGGGSGPPDEPALLGSSGMLLWHPGYPGRSVGVLWLTFDRAGRMRRYEWDRLLYIPQA